jgi:integrase
VLFDQTVIERFALVGAGELSGASRRTVRTNLRFVGRRVAPDTVPAPVALSRERAKAPYSRSEIAAHLACAASQSSLARVMRATGLICLGAGAGLVGRELAMVRGEDVVSRSGGLVVAVSGAKARVVPVLPEFHSPLMASARHAGGRYVIGGVDGERRNVTTPLVRASRVIHLAPIDTGRLRSYWLASCAERIGLASFMAAAGITCSQRLGDIVATLATRTEPEVVALLGARR